MGRQPADTGTGRRHRRRCSSPRHRRRRLRPVHRDPAAPPCRSSSRHRRRIPDNTRCRSDKCLDWRTGREPGRCPTVTNRTRRQVPARHGDASPLIRAVWRGRRSVDRPLPPQFICHRFGYSHSSGTVQERNMSSYRVWRRNVGMDSGVHPLRCCDVTVTICPTPVSRPQWVLSTAGLVPQAPGEPVSEVAGCTVRR
jgi:hypothetical protein